MQYVAQKNTYAVGQETHTLYRLREDHIIEAPKGEFVHLHPTRVRPATDDEALDRSPPETGIYEKGGGWWDIYVDGEEKDTIQGEEDAKARLEELTLPEDR